MNLSSSSNYFPIKNIFSNLFQFETALDWASFSRKVRGLCARIPRPSEQRTGPRVTILNPEGLLC
jgi:hypothetical protein